MVKIMENPIKMDDLEGPPLFLETPLWPFYGLMEVWITACFKEYIGAREAGLFLKQGKNPMTVQEVTTKVYFLDMYLAHLRLALFP